MDGAPAVTATAARLSALAASMGDAEWGRAAAALAEGHPVPDDAGTPTYHDVALTGLAVVEGLADSDRWREAREQAEFLSDFFTGARKRLHAVAGIGFQGLLSAVRGRDRDEIADMAEFLREIFAAGESG